MMAQDNNTVSTWFRFQKEEKGLILQSWGKNLSSLLELDAISLCGQDLLRFIPWGGHDGFLALLNKLEVAGEPACTKLLLLRRSGRSVTLRLFLCREEEYSYMAMGELCDEARPTALDSDTLVYIRTFGYFDVFIGGQAVSFPHAKTKELLALLVDRQGGFVSSSEAVSFLWEEESANNTTLSRYRKVAMRLRLTLEEHGAGDIIQVSRGNRRLVTEKVRCDLYDYLRNPKDNTAFKGYYMTNYSWAETTLAQLSRANP